VPDDMIDGGALSAEEAELVAKLQSRWPTSEIEIEYMPHEGGGMYWVYVDGCYFCGDPTAPARRAKHGRCCAGGPCDDPAADESRLTALKKAVSAMA